MAQDFTDEDLMVITDEDCQEHWDENFVRDHGKEKKPHGQMKLLWSNLLGLTLVEEDMQAEGDNRSIVLVVAGASPGTHMLVLLEHLKQWKESRVVQIHLYDPKALDKDLLDEVSKDSSMYFRRQTFEDADAWDWKRKKKKGSHCLVFFSDIRSDIHGKHEHMRADEAKIAENMEDQKRWVEIMQPDYCMLKFHAPHATPDRPHVPQSFEYLDGPLYEQAFVGLFSAEFRQFCRQPAEAMLRHGPARYDTKAIERHAMWHTRRRRPKTFSVKGVHMPYDDAFAAHVAHKAQELGLILNAHTLLAEARGIGHVSHMHFPWTSRADLRVQALLLSLLRTL